MTSSTGVPPGTSADAVGTPADLGLLDVVLVGDLADQLLEEVLEGDEAGGAAVLVDDDGEVHLLLAHLPQQLGAPAWSRARTGPAGRREPTGSSPWPSRSARTRSLR